VVVEVIAMRRASLQLLLVVVEVIAMRRVSLQLLLVVVEVIAMRRASLQLLLVVVEVIAMRRASLQLLLVVVAVLSGRTIYASSSTDKHVLCDHYLARYVSVFHSFVYFILLKNLFTIRYEVPV